MALVKEVLRTEKYSRLLRCAYKEEIFINEILIREGFVYATPFPLDIMFAGNKL